MTTSVSTLLRIHHAADALSEWSGRATAWLTLLMVLVVCLVAILRYFFNMGWIALQESSLYMHSAIFLVGAAYTLKHEGHVRVDIFYREMSARGRAWVDLLGALVLLFPTFLYILWVSWEYVATSWSQLERSREAGGIPFVYGLKSLIIVMTVLLLIQGLSQVLRSVLVLMGEYPEEEAA